MRLSNSYSAEKRFPAGFVYLAAVDATILQDIRYAGTYNFVGRAYSRLRKGYVYPYLSSRQSFIPSPSLSEEII